MNLKYSKFFIALTTAFWTASASANSLADFYVGALVGAGGVTTFGDGHTDTKLGQSYGAVLGLDIPVLRLEAEYNWLNDDTIKTHVGMVNLYAKMPAVVLQPYFGVGFGTSFKADVDINNAHPKNTATYQGMLGLTFNVPVAPIKIDAEARAMYAPDFYKIQNDSFDLVHYDLRLKLRYVF